MTKTILIDRLCGQTSLALLEDGALAELYFESKGHEKLSGNIYAGRVENVLPGMNAAFVNIGLEKNAFLYAGDIQLGDAELAEQLRGARIERLVRPGQTIVVQVVKEPGGDKGPRLSCHITLPGRLSVFLPTVKYVGISRRIHDEEERERLRAIAEALVQPSEGGIIVRTAAEGAQEKELRDDFEALARLWQAIERRGRHVTAPALLHCDGSLIDRAVRDMLCDEVESVRTEDACLYESLREARNHVGSGICRPYCARSRRIADFRPLLRLEAGGERLQAPRLAQKRRLFGVRLYRGAYRGGRQHRQIRRQALAFGNRVCPQLRGGA